MKLYIDINMAYYILFIYQQILTDEAQSHHWSVLNYKMYKIIELEYVNRACVHAQNSEKCLYDGGVCARTHART